jgi:mannosyltransferase
MQQRPNASLGAVTLVGYDLYKRGYGHAPETPLQPGDLLHFTLYWLAPDPLPSTWPVDQQFMVQLGEQRLTAPLVGGAYPTAQWSPGELVRGEFDILYDGAGRQPILAADGNELRLQPVPDQ